MSTLIIAEAGVNHNGSVTTAKELCLSAKEAGADIVKFQTWVTEKLITPGVKQADYQIINTGCNETQFQMLKRLELSYENFTEIKTYCDKIGITFASTADEQDSLDFLIRLGIPFIKIGSGEICNVPYLKHIGKQNKPIILSTGMASTEDIAFSLHILRSQGAVDISLLHCTTSYPCPFDSVNLKAMQTLKNKFGLPVGYSDHTMGIEVPISAVALGATIIEKHFTLDKSLPGPDHSTSLEPYEFKQMVNFIKNIEKALGNGKKVPTKEEIKISNVVLKRIVAKKSIKKGSIIKAEDICTKRNDKGLLAKYWEKIIGTVATKDYSVDDCIE